VRNGAWRRRQRCWQWDDLFFWTIHTDFRQATAAEHTHTQRNLLRKVQTFTQQYTSGQVPPQCLRRAQDAILLVEAPDLAARAG
jgi:hypothetical protein